MKFRTRLGTYLLYFCSGWYYSQRGVLWLDAIPSSHYWARVRRAHDIARFAIHQLEEQEREQDWKKIQAAANKLMTEIRGTALLRAEGVLKGYQPVGHVDLSKVKPPQRPSPIAPTGWITWTDVPSRLPTCGWRPYYDPNRALVEPLLPDPPIRWEIPRCISAPGEPPVYATPSAIEALRSSRSVAETSVIDAPVDPRIETLQQVLRQKSIEPHTTLVAGSGYLLHEKLKAEGTPVVPTSFLPIKTKPKPFKTLQSLRDASDLSGIERR